MFENEILYTQKLDFTKLPSFVAEQFLGYVFIERFPNLLIVLKDIKSKGNIADLKKLADAQQLRYVLNFPKINFYNDAGISKARITVQFYDQKTNSLLLNTEFIGDWENTGLEFTCPDSSLMCTINNALQPALYAIAEMLIPYDSHNDDEIKLSQQRGSELINNYYKRPYDSAFINKIISSSDSHINPRALYQALTNDTKTKFIAYYYDTTRLNNFYPVENLNSTTQAHASLHTDSNVLSSMAGVPLTSGYIVRGVKFKGNWYYFKSVVNYIKATDDEMGRQILFSTLEHRHFFKEGSIDFNPDFWVMGEFEPVADIKIDPDWNKYRDMLLAQENNDREYIGMPKFMADELKIRLRQENKYFDSVTGRNIFLPFYEAQIKADPDHFARYDLWDKQPTLIFPKSRQYALNPISITDSAGQRTLHFYFAFAGSKAVYEWTYLNPISIKQYSGDIIDQLSTVTNWNFSYINLNDDLFWQKYVLAKSGNEYKYLKRIQ